ncbi:MAG TPA: prolyl oligopeptidase family serine peptidase [Gemmataceae bacterium]|nr:prolyl oligopeptidase family serine peptidase [Gemmataceae bacterium]
MMTLLPCCRTALLTAFSMLMLAGPLHADAPTSDIIHLTHGLSLTRVARYGRMATPTDALFAQIARGQWTAPKAGDTLTMPDGRKRTWQAVSADKNGNFTRLPPGTYVYVAVPAKEQRVLILEAAGHGTVFVNGEPRTGDPYGYGYVHLPVLLRAGTNDLLFQLGRGSLHATLVPPKHEVAFDWADTTVPDLVAGQPVDTWAAVPILNATAHAAENLWLTTTLPGGKPVRTTLPSLLPLSSRKIGFQLQGPAPVSTGKVAVEVRLYQNAKAEGKPLSEARLTLEIKRPEQTRKCTFVSDIDGSVQYYALVPAKKTDDTNQPKPGLILTCHGAGVEAIGQAACYAPKTWANVVAPTNRRPYGFDWEDWGRLDAIEVLNLTQKQLNTDPHRTYLTGHSMGGHGTWYLGAVYPGRFAAIGPSAGWISMWSYAGARQASHPDPVQAILRRAAEPSDTLALKQNYAQLGVYVLHGDRDDNVPVSEARTMRGLLAKFHPDFAYHEQPGAGHWWGNLCVDWPPLIDFLSYHHLPDERDVRHVDFSTVSPGISSRDHWVEIHSQLHMLQPSRVQLDCDPQARRFHGTTDNVYCLTLNLDPLSPGDLHIELDGQTLAHVSRPVPVDSKSARLWLRRDNGRWSIVSPPDASQKGPRRYGPFKEVFRNHVVLVYGTHGTAAENAWALAKARYDAETFGYRGNGSFDVLPDRAFDPKQHRDSNVVLYGNADTNSAYDPLVIGPLHLGHGQVRVAERTEKGDKLGCLFIRPRPDSGRALVGVIGGTGLLGMRLTDRLPYFLSGVGYPDWLVLGPDTLTKGSAGVVGAGFFGPDWAIGDGDSAWRNQRLNVQR